MHGHMAVANVFFFERQLPPRLCIQPCKTRAYTAEHIHTWYTVVYTQTNADIFFARRFATIHRGPMFMFLFSSSSLLENVRVPPHTHLNETVPGGDEGRGYPQDAHALNAPYLRYYYYHYCRHERTISSRATLPGTLGVDRYVRCAWLPWTDCHRALGQDSAGRRARVNDTVRCLLIHWYRYYAGSTGGWLQLWVCPLLQRQGRVVCLQGRR